MRAPEFVFVGNPTASEFRDAVTWLRHNGHTLWLHDLQQLQNSAEHWRAPPTIIILAQEYTQQFSTATIENVRRRWPLSRWVMLLGPWCDGENRSGQPAYGMQRLMWHSFAPIMQQNWRLARTGGLPHWAIPEPGLEPLSLMTPVHPTWTASATTAAATTGTTTTHADHQSVLVIAAHSQLHTQYAELLDSYGYDVHRMIRKDTNREALPAEIHAALWCGELRESSARHSLDQWCRRVGSRRLLVVTAFARPEELRFAKRAGASDVFVEPVNNDRLIAAIRRGTGPKWDRKYLRNTRHAALDRA